MPYVNSLAVLGRMCALPHEYELDDHFDDLTRLYRQVCDEMGLPFPAPDREERVEVHRLSSAAPNLEILMEWEAQGFCEATDGCIVEPDGTCPHGHQSWLLELGMI
jgi:hypothetical protein